jgi:hypothetical protein
MNDEIIAAKPTRYAGTQFRSRLESGTHPFKSSGSYSQRHPARSKNAAQVKTGRRADHDRWA